jgi:hypothetical protein
MQQIWPSWFEKLPVAFQRSQLPHHQRVAGSSLGAPTKQINSLAMFTV